MTSRRPFLVLVTFVLALTLAASVLPASAQSPLSNPAALREQAPAVYKARFDTSKGVFVIEVTRDWAPKAADRFYNLVKYGFYDNVRFFRVISGFMVQFGISGDPAIMARWRAAQISDDPLPLRRPVPIPAPARSSSTSQTIRVSTSPALRRSAGSCRV